MGSGLGVLGQALLDVLSGTTGGVDAADLEREAAAHTSQSLPVVTIVGAYDTGKSSLLRRVVVDDGKEIPSWLTVSARPETFEARECEAFGCILRDTPGLATRNVEHDRRARAALALSDVIVITVPPQLLTWESEAVLQILSGRLFAPHEIALPAPALHIVVTRMDEAGIDPLDNLAGYRGLVERKLQELRDLLARKGLGGRTIQLHALSADPFQRAARVLQPRRSQFDAAREWDGVDAFEHALASFQAQLPALRAAALDRYFMLAADAARRSVEDELERQQLALQACRNDKDRLTLLRDHLDVLSGAARASLDGVVQQEIDSAVRMYGLSLSEVTRAAEVALVRALDGWRRENDAAILQLAREATEDVVLRRRAQSRPSLADMLGNSEDGEHGASQGRGGEWLVEGLRRFGPRVVHAVKALHELNLGMSVAEARRELARVEALGSFEKYVKEAGKRRLLRDAEQVSTATLGVQVHTVLAAVGPLLLELATLYAERETEQRAVRERARRIEGLRAKIGDAARDIAAAEWRDWEEQVTAFRKSLDERMEPIARLEPHLAGVVNQLQGVERRLHTLIGGPFHLENPAALVSTKEERSVESGTDKGGRNEGRPLEVVVSFADADREHVTALEKQLTLAENSGKLRLWHRGKLVPGTPVTEESRRLARADVIVLLVSADYHSERLADAEVAVARMHSGARVIPVLTRVTPMTGAPYDGLAMLPAGGKSIASYEERDEAWTEVVNGILAARG